MNTHSSCWQAKLPHISSALWLRWEETDWLFYYLVSFPKKIASFLFLCKVSCDPRLLQMSSSSADIPSSIPTEQDVLWKDTIRHRETLQEEWHQVRLINGCLTIDAKLDMAQCRKFWFDLQPPLILITGKWHPVHMCYSAPHVKSHKKSAARYWQDNLSQHCQI